MQARTLGMLTIVAAAGCGGSTDSRPTGTGKSTTTMVTAAAGGTVTLEGTTLSVPPGALPADTAITITSSTASPPSTFTTWSSPVFKFEPSGLVFMTPVQVTLTFTGSPAAPAVFWSHPGGGFDNLAGAVQGDHITTSVIHFSEGFVAAGPGPDGPDAGSTPIDGGPFDGGPFDGGPFDGGPFDGGNPTDGTPSADGGTPADGGSPTDGGAPDGAVITDGGIPADGVPSADGGTPVDGGSPVDSGVPDGAIVADGGGPVG